MAAGAPPNKGVALDRAGMTVFRDITFLAAGPANDPYSTSSETGGTLLSERFRRGGDGAPHALAVATTGRLGRHPGRGESRAIQER
jgi:hypothetical protein